MAGVHTRTITEKDFEQSVATGISLVDFWAPWCGPCRMMGPIVDQLATENAGKAVVGKVDVDENASLAERFSVFTIPTLIVFKDGAEIARLVGAKPKSEIQKHIDAAAK